jgi:hypothetical protein
MMKPLAWLLITTLLVAQSSSHAPPLLRSPGSPPSLYQDNGGTAVALAGRGFAVIAADTLIIRGHSVLAKAVSRLHQVH